MRCTIPGQKCQETASTSVSLLQRVRLPNVDVNWSQVCPHHGASGGASGLVLRQVSKSDEVRAIKFHDLGHSAVHNHTAARVIPPVGWSAPRYDRTQKPSAHTGRHKPAATNHHPHGPYPSILSKFIRVHASANRVRGGGVQIMDAMHF